MVDEKTPKMWDPFPVQPFRTAKGDRVERSFIPEWLAQYVYSRLAAHHGVDPPIDYYRNNGGFDPLVILDVLAGGNGNGQAAQKVRRSQWTERSIKNDVPILIPGTKAFDDAMREASGQSNPMFFGGGRKR